MKKIIILSCIVLLIANVLSGMVLSSYDLFNILLSSVVILATGILLYLTDTIYLKDGYKVPFMLLFTIAGALEFFLAIIAPSRITDNWWLILVIGLLAIELMLLIITNTVSKIK